MKKILVSLYLMFCFGVAFGVGENIPTSMGYVDEGVSQKQPKIEATTTGANQVLTNTGVEGTYGKKDIYTTSATFDNQPKSLVDAQTVNAAVQNAINSEFQCYDNDCLLISVFSPTAQQTKNLLDDSFMDNSTYVAVTINGESYNDAKILPTENNKTYTLSTTIVYTGSYYYYIRAVKPDGTVFYPNGGHYMWVRQSGGSGSVNKQFTFTTQDNATYVVYFAAGKGNMALTNYQMEEGSAATPYVPYGNIYMPTAQ